MRRALVFCSVLLALPGCWYESTADLRSSGTSYYVTGAFPAGGHVFQTSDQSNVLMLQVEKEVALVAYQNEGNAPQAVELVSLLGSDSFPDRTYVAVQKDTKKDGTEVFRYFPFWFGKTQITWFKPAMPTEVFGMADLVRHVTEAVEDGDRLTFEMVPVSEQQAVLARFDAWHARESGSPAAAAPPPPPAAVAGLAVGDGVYVSGFFSDSPSIVQEIDEANGRVKVRRYSDGVSEWVAFDRIISRDQSTANDLVRGAATVGVIVCLLSPQSCQGDQQ